MRFPICALLTGASLLALPTLAEAQRLAVPGRGPTNAIAVLSVPDPAGIVQAMDGTPAGSVLGSILDASGLFGTSSFAALDSVRPELESDLGFSLDPKRLFTEAITGMDIYVVDDRRGEKPYGVMMIQFSNDRQAQAVIARLQKDAAGATGNVNNVSANTVTLSRRGDMQILELTALGTSVASTGSTVVVCTNSSAVHNVLDTRTMSPMLNTPEFRGVMTPLVSQPLHAWFYGDTAAMAALWGAGDLSKISQNDFMTNALGSPRVGGTIEVTGSHTRINTFRPMSQLNPVEKAMVANAVSTEFGSGRFLPESPMMATVVNNLDLRALVSSLGQMTGDAAMLGAMTGGGLEEFLLSLGTDLGFGVMDFRLTPFDEIPVTGDAVFVAKVVDEQRLNGVMAQFTQFITGMGASVTNDNHAGAEVRTLRFPMAPGDDAPISPSWVVTRDQFLVIGTSAQTVKNAMDLSGGRGRNFSQGPLVANSQGLFRGRPNNLIGLDMPKVVALLESMITSGSIPQTPETTAAMQRIRPMLNALRSTKGFLSAASYDPSGVFTETFFVF